MQSIFRLNKKNLRLFMGEPISFIKINFIYILNFFGIRPPGTGKTTTLIEVKTIEETKIEYNIAKLIFI